MHKKSSTYSSQKFIKILLFPRPSFLLQYSTNELTEKIAKQSTKINSILELLISLSDVEKSTKLVLQTGFCNYWNPISTLNKLKEIQPSTDPYLFPNNRSWKEEIILTRSLKSHSLSRHRYLFNKKPSHSCDSWNTPSLSNIYIIKCFEYHIQKNQLLLSKYLLAILTNNPEDPRPIVPPSHRFVHSTIKFSSWRFLQG